MSLKSFVAQIMIVIFLSACASEQQKSLLTQAYEIRQKDIPPISTLFGSPVEVIFQIENNEISIIKGNLVKESDKNHSKKESTNQNKDSKLGCVRIKDQSTDICDGYFDSDIFKTEKINNPVSMVLEVALFTAVLPITAVVDTKHVKDNIDQIGQSVIDKKYDPSIVQDMARLVNYKIFNQYREIERTEDPEKMEEFLKNYDVKDKNSPAFQLLISLHRKKNDFDHYMKAYEITGEKDDLRGAYKMANTSAQKQQIESIVKESEESEMRALAGAAIGGLLFVGAVKYLFGAIDSAMSSASSGSLSAVDSSSNSSSCGVTDTCYVLIKHEESAAYVQCIKGPSIGKEMCLSYKATTGKYASDCSVSSAFEHHYKLEEAGNIACRY